MNKEASNVKEELQKIEAERAWAKVKYLSVAVATVGTLRVGQIVLPTVMSAVTGNVMLLGALAVPYYFLVPLGALAVMPVYSEFKKAQKEKVNRKSDEVSNDECFKLED